MTWNQVQGLTRVGSQLCSTLLGSAKLLFNAFNASPVTESVSLVNESHEVKLAATSHNQNIESKKKHTDLRRWRRAWKCEEETPRLVESTEPRSPRTPYPAQVVVVLINARIPNFPLTDQNPRPCVDRILESSTAAGSFSRTAGLNELPSFCNRACTQREMWRRKKKTTTWNSRERRWDGGEGQSWSSPPRWKFLFFVCLVLGSYFSFSLNMSIYISVYFG